MPTDIKWVQGDTGPAVADTLTNADGSVPNFQGATVKFQMRSLTASTLVTLTGTASFTNPGTGAVQFVPSAADTGTAGMYMASWQVTFSGGGIQTWPTDGYLSVNIEPNLANAASGIVSLADAKDYLNIQPSDRTRDAKLIRFITAVTPLIENITGPILVRTFDEWHAGGQYFIRLRRRPSNAIGMSPVFTIIGCDEYRGPIKYSLSVVSEPTAASIYSVMLDPRVGTITRRTTGGGVIPFGAGPWMNGLPGAVHVVYQAGQQTVPANVAEAALEAIRVNYQRTQQVGRGRRTQADEFDTGPPLGFYLPRLSLELLAPLRRHVAVA